MIEKFFCHENEKGSILVEGLIALALLLMIVSAMVPMFTLSSETTVNNKIQTVAYNAASEELEKIKAMAYDDIGTVGGYPAGTLIRDTAKTIDNIEFSITTDVRWEDDAGDGLALSETDPDGRDYKLITITFAWEGAFGHKNLKLNTKIARQSEDQAFIGGNVKVVAEDTLGNPIEGVCITMPICPSTASEISGYTDENGEFIFYALNPSVSSDDCIVSALKAGYLVQPNLAQLSTTVLLNKTSTVTFVMERPGILNIKLVDQYDNEITSSTTITVASAFTSDTAYANTEGGTYTLNDLYPGIWTVLPSAEGFEATTTASAAQVNPAQLTVLTIKLQPLVATPRQFFVYDSVTLLGIDNAQVSATNNGTHVEKHGSTDSSGTCELDLIDGNYSLSVSKTGYATSDSVISFNESINSYTIYLDPACQTTFTVSDPDGDPIDGATVQLTGAYGVETSSTVGGACTLELRAGTYSMIVSKPGFDDTEGTVIISLSGANFPITLNYKTYPTTVTVIDSDGYAIGGATVRLTKLPSGAVTTGLTDSSGPTKGIFSINMLAGNYTLEVLEAEHTPNPNTSAIEISTGGGNDFTRTLTAITYASNFTVLETDLDPISGATVQLTNNSTGKITTGPLTNGSGVSTINLAAGTYTRVVSKTGYTTDTQTTVVIASGGSDSTITLPQNGAILVYVRSWWFGNYYPRDDINIRVTRTTPSYNQEIETGSGSNDEGEALFSDLESGTYTVERWGRNPSWPWNWGWRDAQSITVTAENTSNHTYTISW